MSLATLSVDLEARLAKYTSDMGQAARVTEKSAAQISAALGTVKASIAGLAAGVTFGGLVAFTRAAVNSLDALNDLKDATGASIENISGLEDVAARTGTTLDTVGTALVKFNSVLKDAKPGTDQEAAFKALSLSVKELQSLDPAEALRLTAVALANFADDGNKARLVQELFGKSVREVAPYLKDLAEQGALVAKVTTQQAEEAEKFNKELYAMQKNVQDLTRFIAGGLVSSLNEVAARFRDGAKAGKSFLEIAVENYQGDAAKYRRALTDAIGLTTPQAKSGQFVLNYGSPSVNDTAAARLRRQGAFDKPSVNFTGAAEKAKALRVAHEQEASALDRYTVQLLATIEREQELTAVQTAQLRISEASAQGFSEAKRKYVLELAAQIDKERELKAEQEDRIRVGRQNAIDNGVDNTAYQARLKGLLDNTTTAKIQAITDDIGVLQDELNAGRISLDQYVEAVQGRVGIVADEVTKTKSFAEEMGLAFTSAFEDAIVGGQNFSQVLKGLQQDILRIVVRKTITQPLGDYFSGLVSKFLPSFDVGTPYVPYDMVAKIHKGERIVPAAENRRGTSSGATIIIQQTVGDVATVDMLRKSNQALVRQIQAGLGRSAGYGGALS